MKILNIINQGKKATKLYHTPARYHRILDIMAKLYNYQVVHCYSTEQVKNNIEGTTCIILGGRSYSYISFWDELVFLNELDIPIVLYCHDSHTPPLCISPEEIKVDIKVDALLLSCKELALDGMQNHKEASKGKGRFSWEGLEDLPLLWYPPAVDIYQGTIRDIDIISWGRLSKLYPFRCLVNDYISKQQTSIIEDTKPLLQYLPVKDKQYISFRIRQLGQYRAKRLYNILIRCKISCTGPSKIKCHGSDRSGVAVGKYFENAACGVVSLTPPFTDREELGFVHGENIWFTTPDTWLEDLYYLLENPDILNTLSINGYKLIEERHTEYKS